MDIGASDAAIVVGVAVWGRESQDRYSIVGERERRVRLGGLEPALFRVVVFFQKNESTPSPFPLFPFASRFAFTAAKFPAHRR